ncbi:MAG: methionine gamma-lyase [Acidobacteria bacterium]|nr:MAG: methionine gamma-lyase [Acidobacteriota bacterium]
MSKEKRFRYIDTAVIHAGEETCPRTGAVDTPIYQSTTFAFDNANEGAELFSHRKDGYVYTRYGNPTLNALEEKIAALEGAEAAQVTASGMSAISTCVLSLVQGGDHIVSARSIYSAAFDLFFRKLLAWGVEVSFVGSTSPDDFARAMKPNTRLVYIETPSNPILNVLDIAAIARIAKKQGCLSVIDNTFATPINTRPLELGVDLVIHSATKYFCGHGDAMGGAIAGSRDLIRSISVETHRDLGGVMSPFNAWLILRGLRTLALRMERHNANAMQIAEFLQNHPKVEKVFYPGLPDHPGHDVARNQMRGFGGIVGFVVRGGLEAGKYLLDNVRLCTLAVSLGDTRTLITHPASTTHVVVPREKRLEIGIFDGLVRLSVGIENVQDLKDDLDQALAGVSR